VKVNDHYPSLLLALVIIAIPLFSIFLFKDRKKQIRISAIALVANAGFISMMLMRVNQYNQTIPTPTQGSYGIGAILPFVAVILLGLAIGGIRKDEKLVKSLDRLR
jgi:cytochrome c biogenesis factor